MTLELFLFAQKDSCDFSVNCKGLHVLARSTHPGSKVTAEVDIYFSTGHDL